MKDRSFSRANVPVLSRRAALGGGLCAATLSATSAPRSAAAAPAPQDDICMLTPQLTEGPFYVDPHLLRSDIREDRQGVPLRLALRVVEAGSCAPLARVRIDLWHADARGLYSGFEGQGDGRDISMKDRAFLRGTQFCDERGLAAFDTIYPGWYFGRATHMHFKVFLDGTVATGQIFFPDALSEFIYANVAAYKNRPIERLVINANDSIAAEDAQHIGYCAIKEERARYLATLTLGVDPHASARHERRPPPPGGRPDGPPSDAPGSEFPAFGGGPPRPTPVTDRIRALIPGLP